MGERREGARSARDRLFAFVGRRRGQSLVEFAIVLPVVLVMLVTAIDLGRAYYYYTQMANAVRVGAAYAVNEGSALTSHTVSERQAIIENYIVDHSDLNPPLAVSDISFTAVSGGGDMTQGDVDEITVHHDFALITPLAQALAGGATIDLTYTVAVTYV